MNLDIIELDETQITDIESRLAQYDDNHISYKMSEDVNIGILLDGKLIAGASACMTTFKILYVSTVFVDEAYRGKGIGRRLMAALEKKAVNVGANMIRLDTFDWQGADFYSKLGYEQVGYYANETDGFSEHFFLKRL